RGGRTARTWRRTAARRYRAARCHRVVKKREGLLLKHGLLRDDDVDVADDTLAEAFFHGAEIGVVAHGPGAGAAEVKRQAAVHRGIEHRVVLDREVHGDVRRERRLEAAANAVGGVHALGGIVIHAGVDAWIEARGPRRPDADLGVGAAHGDVEHLQTVDEHLVADEAAENRSGVGGELAMVADDVVAVGAQLPPVEEELAADADLVKEIRIRVPAVVEGVDAQDDVEEIERGAIAAAAVELPAAGVVE